METLKSRIKDLMQAENLRQEDVAKRLKITSRTWSRWMADPNIITLGNFVCIANILGVTPAELFGRSERDIENEKIAEGYILAIKRAGR